MKVLNQVLSQLGKNYNIEDSLKIENDLIKIAFHRGHPIYIKYRLYHM